MQTRTTAADKPMQNKRSLKVQIHSFGHFRPLEWCERAAPRPLRYSGCHLGVICYLLYFFTFPSRSALHRSLEVTQEDASRVSHLESDARCSVFSGRPPAMHPNGQIW